MKLKKNKRIARKAKAVAEFKTEELADPTETSASKAGDQSPSEAMKEEQWVEPPPSSEIAADVKCSPASKCQPSTPRCSEKRKAKTIGEQKEGEEERPSPQQTQGTLE